MTKNLIHETPEVLHHIHDGLFRYPFETEEFTWSSNVALYWLPIPTPADLEKWDEVRSTLQRLVDLIDSGDEPGDGSPWHLRAKAALAAAKEDGDGNSQK